MRKNGFNLIAIVLLVALAFILAPSQNADATFKPHAVGAGNWTFVEASGTPLRIGANDLSAGHPAIESTQAVVLHFNNSTNYGGFNAGLLKSVANTYMAMTNDCTEATWKSDSTSNGTIWAFEPLGNGIYHILNRYCDQKLSTGAIQVVLAGRNVFNHQYTVCDDVNNCNGFFIRFTAVPEP